MNYLTSLLWLSFTVISAVGQNATINKVVLCHQPTFYTKFNCGATNPSSGNVTDMIMLDVAKMPFNLDQWIHIDIIPTPSALSSGETLKITHAMIQLNDESHRIIGRIGEQIPCEDSGHPQYMNGIGEMSQLYRNPTTKNITVIECPSSDDLSYNFRPTVGIFSFPRGPVTAFYVNVGFTKEEGDFIRLQTGKIFITTLLVDDNGSCYLHRVGPLTGVPNPGTYTRPDPSAPVACHHVGPAFQTEDKKQTPLRMEGATVTWEAVEFGTGMDLGLRSRIRIPHVSNPGWKDEIAMYNLKTNGIDVEGYTAAERRERAEKEDGNKTKEVVRRPNVPLVVIDDEDEENEINNALLTSARIFDEDDAECDDNLRIHKPVNVKDDVAKLYLDCAYSKECIGTPEGCLDDRNCDIVVGWGKEGDYLAFRATAKGVTYVAVAVSKDDKMGNDSVTECVREEDLVAGYTSWNFKDDENLGNMRMRSCESMKDFSGGIIDNTRIFCSWKRPIVTNVKGHTFDLDKPHFILSATGHTTMHGVYGNIVKHEQRRVASPTAEVLNKFVGKSPLQYWIARMHGILMLIVWMVIVPLAVFVPRYLKGTFVTRRIKGYSVWYGLHLILVSINIVLTLGSTILLVIFNNYERAKSESRFSDHSTLGLVICLALFLQGSLAYLMMEGNNKWRKRWHINYIHGIVGHLTVICGYACIFTARYIKDGLPCNIIISYSLYLVLTVILHLMMAYQICYSDFVRGRSTSRVYKIFLVDRDKEHDQPTRPRRRKTATLQAELERKRRLTLDEVEVDELEEGQVINPKFKGASKIVMEPEYRHVFEKEEEEPGALMRRVILLVFLLTTGLFTLYYVILMLMPTYYLDCPSQKWLEPGVQYDPGHLYF